MARPFRHKRPRKPEADAAVFKLLRVMAGRTTAEIARKTWVSPSTISKLRTRRTRYPQHATYAEILRALGYDYVIVPKDGSDNNDVD